jgi:penicillin-binding protein 1A
VLYDHGVDRAPRQGVIGQPALAYMVSMMRGVIHGGTGGRASVPGYDLAGKTGTTSDYRDAWFVGYTGGFVTAVWVGKDNNTPMRKVTGGAAPAGIWKDYMTAALPRLKVATIPGGDYAPPEPPNVIDQIVDGVTGLLKGGHDQAPPRREEPPY